ncbi:hypothetical protein AB0J68_31625 [Micromonospora sp. NPDC049580]|uniref:hypothetical protein n=1 Tax=Micromonospora sp. NPDC049580 TaxID=3154832 RepID=UPI00342E8246
MVDAFGFIADLSPWSPWMPFALAIQQAPRLPGVYLARQPARLAAQLRDRMQKAQVMIGD